MLLKLIVSMCIVSTLLLGIALLKLSTKYLELLTRINVMETRFNVIDVDIRHLGTTVEACESRIDALTQINEELENYEQEQLSEFDARIAQFRDELNTPTYKNNDAVTYHPGVYNVPHGTVQDTPLKYKPEYAE